MIFREVVSLKKSIEHKRTVLKRMNIMPEFTERDIRKLQHDLNKDLMKMRRLIRDSLAV